MDSTKIHTLQKQLALAEQQFMPLIQDWKQGSPEWENVAKAAAELRRKLFDLTGDWYGKPKTARPAPPADEVLSARYDSPEEVPAEVMYWVRMHSQLITSDATDAVRWARIVDTQSDERYPPGDLEIYRAVVLGADTVEEIRPGDWVSTSLAYVKDHLERYLGTKGVILTETVDGNDVLASPTGNSEEAIFAPYELSGSIDAESQSDREKGN